MHVLTLIASCPLKHSDFKKRILRAKLIINESYYSRYVAHFQRQSLPLYVFHNCDGDTDNFKDFSIRTLLSELSTISDGWYCVTTTLSAQILKCWNFQKLSTRLAIIWTNEVSAVQALRSDFVITFTIWQRKVFFTKFTLSFENKNMLGLPLCAEQYGEIAQY